ncbi:MAG: GTP-binding protein [Ruminococcus sp.]|nr:GTP-binding protein [Ruminococcus sp.]
MVKVSIFSGFLGAGKTTLIKKLLSDCFKDEKVVLIENEFGEVGIDGGFLKDAGIEITEMNSGCICCTLAGDFTKSLGEVLEKFSPDRVIIEPSGVGKLSDVISAVQKTSEVHNIEFSGFITVADASKYQMFMKAFGEFYNNQIEYADAIVLSRTQNIPEKKLMDCVNAIKTINDKATIITTPWDTLDGSIIMNAIEGKSKLADELIADIQHEQEEHEHCHHHHHDDEEHEHHHEHDEHCHHHHHDDEEHEHHHEHGEHCHHHHDEEHEHHHEHDEHCHHHHADDTFTSWGVETPKKFTKDELTTILEKLSNSEDYGIILRSKGIVPSADGDEWYYFDLVPQEYEIRTGKADYTGKLCVIGSKIDEDSLKLLFNI